MGIPKCIVEVVSDHSAMSQIMPHGGHKFPPVATGLEALLVLQPTNNTYNYVYIKESVPHQAHILVLKMISECLVLQFTKFEI